MARRTRPRNPDPDIEAAVPQHIYPFSLVYAEAASLPERFEDPLFEAGCDDATLLIKDGLLRLDFDREAPSFREALTSAIRDVEKAALPIRLIRVEPL